MTPFQAFILGIIQGLTEFLPISSSGHLVITPFLLGWNIPPEEAFIFDILVQVATLLAVIAYFWRELTNIGTGFLHGLLAGKPLETPSSRLGWYLILATIPAGVIGILFKDTFAQAFDSPLMAGLFLLITAGMLFTAERAGKRNRNIEQLSHKDALWIGFFQALAILPGISRSGSTITGGMLRNLDRATAAKFSFLMSIPIMLAAGLIASIDLFSLPNFGTLLSTYIWGFISSAIVGYLSIRWLLKYLLNHSLYGFAIYCVVLGLTTIFAYALNY
jgi:undecaprenyl-diphosphatase